MEVADTAKAPRGKRGFAFVIGATAVVILVMVAGIAYYLDIHRYPSEDTPLVLYPWGISLVRENLSSGDEYPPPPFANISLYWGEDGENWLLGAPSVLTSANRLNASDFNLPDDFTTLDRIYQWGWMSDDIVDGVRVLGPKGIIVTDVDGDELFDYGDAISLFFGTYENGTLTHQGFSSNKIYLFGLQSHGYPVMDHWHFKYAIHHGTLYAWASSSAQGAGSSSLQVEDSDLLLRV